MKNAFCIYIRLDYMFPGGIQIQVSGKDTSSTKGTNAMIFR
jgi:hypothetical protein